jgi:hypothetical protein
MTLASAFMHELEKAGAEKEKESPKFPTLPVAIGGGLAAGGLGLAAHQSYKLENTLLPRHRKSVKAFAESLKSLGDLQPPMVEFSRKGEKPESQVKLEANQARVDEALKRHSARTSRPVVFLNHSDKVNELLNNPESVKELQRELGWKAGTIPQAWNQNVHAPTQAFNLEGTRGAHGAFMYKGKTKDYVFSSPYAHHKVVEHELGHALDEKMPNTLLSSLRRTFPITRGQERKTLLEEARAWRRATPGAERATARKGAMGTYRAALPAGRANLKAGFGALLALAGGTTALGGLAAWGARKSRAEIENQKA